MARTDWVALVTDVIAEVTAAIAASALDVSARQRVSAALPCLSEAISKVGTLPDAFVLAAATPLGSLVFRADEGWPSVDDIGEFDAAAVAGTVFEAIETPAIYLGDLILAGIALLLGRAGVAAQNAKAIEIARSGKKPVLTVLMAKEGRNIDILITVVAMEQQTLH
jgi:hypothetical protein